MTYQNKYPVVLLHGMFGFGQQQITNDFLPYFGLWTTDVRKMFIDMGVPCVAPSMGGRALRGAFDGPVHVCLEPLL